VCIFEQRVSRKPRQPEYQIAEEAIKRKSLLDGAVIELEDPWCRRLRIW